MYYVKDFFSFRKFLLIIELITRKNSNNTFKVKVLLAPSHPASLLGDEQVVSLWRLLPAPLLYVCN